MTEVEPASETLFLARNERTQNIQHMYQLIIRMSITVSIKSHLWMLTRRFTNLTLESYFFLTSVLSDISFFVPSLSFFLFSFSSSRSLHSVFSSFPFILSFSFSISYTVPQTLGHEGDFGCWLGNNKLFSKLSLLTKSMLCIIHIMFSWNFRPMIP
jgi:hypothetical protein